MDLNSRSPIADCSSVIFSRSPFCFCWTHNYSVGKREYKGGEAVHLKILWLVFPCDTGPYGIHLEIMATNMMEPWYKNATPRAEVREGRSFNPDEFAIALEQVAAGKGPEDYRDPVKFVSRTCFTRALTEHMGMVLRRLAGRTENSAPVMTLVTPFGGGKTHTLTALYHLAKSGQRVRQDPAIASLLATNGLNEVPTAKVAVFVGNAWDPGEGRETPWIDVARQLAGDAGLAALGTSAKEIPPGTASIAKLVEVAGGSV